MRWLMGQSGYIDLWVQRVLCSMLLAPVGTRVRIWSPTPPSCIVRGDKMGQPVCRGLRPVSVDEGILEVEDNWVLRIPCSNTPLWPGIHLDRW